MSEPLARSPITPVPPVAVVSGWEVSARRAGGALTLTDCTPLAKVCVRSVLFGVPFGRAVRDIRGVLTVGSGPGEWMLIGPPGSAAELMGRVAHASCVDLTHGRALLRLSGENAGAVLAKLCGVDLCDEAVPDGAAFRTSVAALATDIIRDDQAETRSYLLHCERSSGQYLFDTLLGAGGEFGIEIDGFTSPEG